MARTNTSAVRKTLQLTGQPITIRQFDDGSNPTYDADSEEPTYGTPNISSIIARIERPTKEEIDASGGKVTDETKKFIIQEGITVSTGDTVLIAGGTPNYIIDRVDEFTDHTVIFARNEDKE